MELIPKSGFYYSNKFARITLEAYEEIMGKNGLNAILHMANLSNLIENFPPDNMKREFDFADLTAIHLALEEMYGSRGGRGLALRAGRATFNNALKNFGALASFGDAEFRVLPILAKIRIGMPTAAKIFSQVTDQLTTAEETDTAFIWTIHRCPICWTRKNADKPVCYIWTGLLQALLIRVAGDLEFEVNESKCCAVGDSVCEFVVNKDSIP